MRWSYLIPRFCLLTLVWTFFAFVFDPMLRHLLVTGGQTVAGASVDIGQFSTSLFPPSLTIGQLQIADARQPMQNLIDCESIAFNVEGKPLLNRSIVIDEATITGVRFGTARTSSGALKGADTREHRQPSWADKLRDKLIGKLSSGASDWIDGLTQQVQNAVDIDQLESVQVARARREAWKLRFTDLELRAEDLEGRIADLKSSTGQAGNAIEKLEQYQKSALEVKRLMAELQQIRDELKQLPQLARIDLQEIDAARLRDQQRVKDLTGIVKIDRQQITESLLGPDLAARLQEAVSWIGYIQSYTDDLSEPSEPDRSGGWDVVFAQDEPTPQFLLRKATISGETGIGTKQFQFSGTVTGITSQPLVYGQPLELQLSGEGDLTAQLRFSRNQQDLSPSDYFDLYCRLPQPLRVQLGESDKISIVAEAPTTVCRLQLAINDQRLSGRMALQQEEVHITTANTGDPSIGNSNPVQRALQSALENIHRLQADVHIAGTVASPEWSLESNLGSELAEGLNNVLVQQLAGQRAQLQEKIDLAAQDQSAQFKELLNQRYGKLTSQLDLNENQARQLIQRVAGNDSLKLNKLIPRF